MMRFDTVIALFADLDRGELVGWIARRWVRPVPEGEDYLFADIDVARVRLIHDLRRAMSVTEEAMPLVLSLLDQVYELRGTLARMSDALAAQPETVRLAVADRLREGKK
jgi:chaperone modulatory protein CbpM